MTKTTTLRQTSKNDVKKSVKLENEFEWLVFGNVNGPSCLVAEESFDKKSVLGMDYQTVIHTICFIEQQLLLEDHSSSIHNPESLKDEVKQKLENENVRLVNNSN